MRYPADVFTGKVRDYTGSRPSAIAKVQIDGELMLTELGLTGDEQAEAKIHGGPDRALCHYPREHYLDWIREFPQQADLFCAPAFGENLSTEGLTEKNVYIGDIFRWGGIMGAITWWLYDDPQLGGVMTLAMMLNLLMAAMMGVIIPMVMVKLGRDPAVGSSVMITAITDTGGFFIFLGLATLFLM